VLPASSYTLFLLSTLLACLFFTMRCSASLIAWLSFGALTLASPLPDSSSKDKRSFVERDGTNYTVFEHAATGVKMELVTNSGICETTPGVNQYSGYLSVGTNMNMWFWLYVIPSGRPQNRWSNNNDSFEARSNLTTAPLATWFNGGPGCSRYGIAALIENFLLTEPQHDWPLPRERPVPLRQRRFNALPEPLQLQ